MNVAAAAHVRMDGMGFALIRSRRAIRQRVLDFNDREERASSLDGILTIPANRSKGAPDINFLLRSA
jgi:hypothetical protein